MTRHSEIGRIGPGSLSRGRSVRRGPVRNHWHPAMIGLPPMNLCGGGAVLGYPDIPVRGERKLSPAILHDNPPEPEKRQ